MWEARLAGRGRYSARGEGAVVGELERRQSFLQKALMKHKSLLRGLAAALLTLPSAAMALPDDAGELRQIVATKFGGDANTYVIEESGDFRRMACRNRADLVQQLLDDGLVVSDVPYRTLKSFYQCAFDENEWDALALIIDPETLARVEQEAGNLFLPLQDPVYSNNYKATRLLLENGAYTVDNRGWTKGVLTKDGHRLNIAGFAVRQNLNEVLRAFEDAGYAEIAADARQPGFWDLVYNVGTGKEIGGGLGGMLGGVADLVVGAALGGSPTDYLIASAGSAVLDNEADGGADGEAMLSQISDVELQRKLARYLVAVEMPPEAEPESIVSPNTENAPATQKADVLGDLERLADLRDRGMLTDEEFEAMKARVLEGS